MTMRTIYQSDEERLIIKDAIKRADAQCKCGRHMRPVFQMNVWGDEDILWECQNCGIGRPNDILQETSNGLD
jgi:hypothetical protein